MSSLNSNSLKSCPEIAGYRIVEQLYLGSRTAVYRALQISTQRSVVIKVLRREYPSFGELVQFRNQYAIAKNLPIPGIIQPLSLEPVGSGYALVMEDWGGVALASYIQQQSLDLTDILAIATQYLIDSLVRDGLNEFQQSLELSDEDVARIEAPLVAPKEVAYQQQLAEEQRRKAAEERQLERERQEALERQRVTGSATTGRSARKVNSSALKSHFGAIDSPQLPQPQTHPLEPPLLQFQNHHHPQIDPTSLLHLLYWLDGSFSSGQFQQALEWWE